jgi:hypothetical protein
MEMKLVIFTLWEIVVNNPVWSKILLKRIKLSTRDWKTTHEKIFKTNAPPSLIKVHVNHLRLYEMQILSQLVSG